MANKTISSFRRLLAAIATVGAVFAWCSPSQAYIQKIVVDSTNTANYFPVPLGTSTPATSAVSYTIYTGRIFGVLNPNNPLNAVITDLNLAAPVGGSYSYISQFSIVTPTNPAQRSGLLIYESSNRGGSAITTSAMLQGATYVQSGWQGDLLSQCSGAPNSLPVTAYPCVDLSAGPYGTASASYPFYTAPTGLTDFVIQVPVATTDGSPPNGTNNISGPVYSHVKTGATGTTAQMVVYSSAFTPFQPVSTDTNQAQFWYETSQTTNGQDIGGPTPIPSTSWSWAYCPNGPPGTPNPFWICLNNGATFNSSYLYEMSYTAVNPLVQGVGFAGIRDFVSFLRYGTTAPGGGSNPLAGTAFNKTMMVGVSQDGALVRSTVFYGFNEDEDGRVVFDGLWSIIDGRELWMIPRWSQPNVILNLYMGGDEAPNWWSDYPDQFRGFPPEGMLDRCTATGTCPQVLETWGGNEWYNNKMGPDFVGYCTTCTVDIPQPSSVYRYVMPGATHGGATVSFNWSAPPTTTPISSSQTYPSSPIPETYTNNALQYAFVELLMNNTPMPSSGAGITYPSVTAGTLVPNTQAAMGWPNIPGVTFDATAYPPIMYNYGPGENYQQQTGVPTINPPQIQQVLAAYVPAVNSDGNEIGGGLPSVLQQAPLGTYMSWNVIPPGSPYVGQQVQLTAGYWPFYDTAAKRTAAGDPRLSLEERYGSNLGYKCVARDVANVAVEQRFLLQSDANLLITGTNGTITLAAPINKSNVLASASPGFVPTLTDTSLANTKCFRTDSHDFNGAGMSDILWHDTSGDVAMWLMNAGVVSSSAGVGNATTNWSIVGQRDFNGDGNADILWHDSSGDVAIWFMNGSSVTQSAGVGNANPAVWSIAGTGDFNGDGKGDILWRDSSGDVAIWEMSGSTVLQSCGVGNAPTTWSIVGTGDFNGDGHSDILWRDSSGNVSVWFMNGCSVTQSSGIGNAPSTWSVAGTGDFNGDGKSDILWHDTSGNVAVWLMNGSTVLQSAGVGNAATVWSVAATGDFNGDGYSDILWEDTTGDVALWEMNGAQVIQSSGVGTAPSVWTVQGLGAD